MTQPRERAPRHSSPQPTGSTTDVWNWSPISTRSARHQRCRFGDQLGQRSGQGEAVGEGGEQGVSDPTSLTGCVRVPPHKAPPHKALPHKALPHKALPHKAPPHKAPPHKAPPHKAPPVTYSGPIPAFRSTTVGPKSVVTALPSGILNRLVLRGGYPVGGDCDCFHGTPKSRRARQTPPRAPIRAG